MAKVAQFYGTALRVQRPYRMHAQSHKQQGPFRIRLALQENLNPCHLPAKVQHHCSSALVATVGACHWGLWGTLAHSS